MPSRYLLPSLWSYFWVFTSEKNLICSFHWYLQSLPHAAPSAWTTSLKRFCCPWTIYPYNELTSALPPRKKISFLISTARNKTQIWTKTMALSYCDVQNTSSPGWYRLPPFKWTSFAGTRLFIVDGQWAEPGLPVTKMNRQMARTKMVTFGPSQGCHF